MISQKGQTLIFVLIGILVIVGIAGGAYYLGRQTSQKPSPGPVVTFQTSQPSPIKDASPAPTGAGETANWKTYYDPQRGITFKYPPTGIVQTFASQSQVVINNDSKPPYFYFTIGIAANTHGLTSKQVLENEVQTLRNSNNIPGDGTKLLADYRQSTIKAYQNGLIIGSFMRWGKDGDSVSDAIEVVSINNNKIYTFSIHDGNGSITEFQKNLLDKILSTFKFQ